MIWKLGTTHRAALALVLAACADTGAELGRDDGPEGGSEEEVAAQTQALSSAMKPRCATATPDLAFTYSSFKARMFGPHDASYSNRDCSGYYVADIHDPNMGPARRRKNLYELELEEDEEDWRTTSPALTMLANGGSCDTSKGGWEAALCPFFKQECPKATAEISVNRIDCSSIAGTTNCPRTWRTATGRGVWSQNGTYGACLVIVNAGVPGYEYSFGSDRYDSKPRFFMKATSAFGDPLSFAVSIHDVPR
jgi:hypothetical protein